ncbi:MAG: hypothetical protein JRI68_35765 [Deltaproteobacteria bacterium]|nr:hypothetical protein [Deltaproteobacteria bacterium]
MSRDSDSDRTRILQRRAVFLSSALTALGCSAQPPQPADGPVVTIPDPPPADPAPTATPTATPEAPPPKDAPPGEQPSLEIPTDVGEVAKRKFEHFAKSMKRLYELLDEMAAALPEDCDILDAACDERWKKLALLGMEKGKVTMFLHHCPGSSDDAKRFEAFHKEHQDYRGRRQAQLDGRISRALASGGAAARKRWEDHQQQARAANPVPCLSFACRDW